MSAQVQLLVALFIVTLAGLYLLRGLWRFFRHRQAGCSSDCGGSAGKTNSIGSTPEITFIPLSQVGIRQRKEATGE